MKIKEIRIDGFGHFSGEEFGPLNPSIVIFSGENEAGKSTILNFIRTTLFGFPTRGRDDHYPPINGGQHGGRLVVTGSDGIDYIVERYVGSKGGNVRVLGMDGNIYPVSKLMELTGHASKDLFENIFAFSLDELQSSQILEDENVNSQIYSAGMGVTNLPSLLDKLQTQMNRLYRPRGSVGLVNKCAADLDEIDKQIRELTKHSEQYSNYRVIADKADETKVELQGEKATLLKRLTRLTAMKDSWPSYIESVTLKQELEQFPEYPDLPVNPISKLENFLGALHTAKEEFESAELDKSSAKMEYDEININELIIADQDSIENINQRKSSFLNSIKDLPERIAELSGLDKLVDETIKTLGEEWDTERLKSTDLGSIPVSIEIDGYRDKIGAVKEKVLIEENTVEERERDFAQSDSDTNSAKSELSKLPEPKLDSHQLLQVSQIMNHLESSKNVLDSIQTNNSAEPEENSFSDFFSEKGLLLAIFIGGVLFSLLLFLDKETIFGTASILISTASLIWFLKLQFLPSRTLHSNQQNAAPTISNLEISITENIDLLKTMNLSGESITDFRKTFTSINAESAQQEKLNEKIKALEEQLEKYTHQLSYAKENVKKSQANQKETQEEWEKWLSDKDLPTVLTPIAMSDYLGQIRTGKERLLNAETMAERIEAIRTDISEYTSLIIPIAENHEIEFEVGDNNSLLNVAESLLNGLAVERDKNSKKDQKLSDLKKFEMNLSKRKQNLETVDQSIKSLLEEASTDTIDKYRHRAESLSDKKQLESRLRELELILQTSSGPAEHYKRFLSELSQISLEEIDSSISELNNRISEIDNAYTQTVEEGAQANQLIDQLIDEDKLSSLQIEKTQLQEQLRENITLWTKLWLASDLLRKGRDKFQSERQPGVIKQAEIFLKTITSDRYKGMYAPIGGDELTVIDEFDFNKNPNQLSRGTKEQLFLSLRFGLIKEYGESIETLPVIVDEVLVNFDPERAVRSCSAFAQLADTNQIIVFTCHPDMVDAFKSVSSDVQVIPIGKSDQ